MRGDDPGWTKLLAGIQDIGILRSSDRRLISPTGANNSWLLDLRRVLTRSEFLQAAAKLFWNACKDYMPFQVGGLEVGSVPLISAILMESVARSTPVTGFFVRKERKTSGAGNLIEGEITDLPIILVDDIINSGESFLRLQAALGDSIKKVSVFYALVNYGSAKAKDRLLEHGVEIISTYTLEDLGLNASRYTPAQLPPLFKQQWRFSSPDPNFHERVPKSFPATDGERVYFGSDCGTFWALNCSDGSVAWSSRVITRQHKNIWSSPIVSRGRVYFGGYDGNVYCLDARTGGEVWRFGGADWVGSSPAISIDLGLLFIGLEFAIEGKKGSICALKLATGEKAWEHLTRRYTHASPAYCPERQLVACGSNDNEMFLFKAKTGEVVWRFETRGDGRKGSIRHAPAFDHSRGQLVTGCADGYIYVLDLVTGAEIWSVKTDDEIYSVPLVFDRYAYIGSADKYFYILDLQEKKLHTRFYSSSRIFGPPRLIQGSVFFGACDGVVYKINPQTLTVEGKHHFPDAITSAIAFNRKLGHYYVSTFMNEIFAMRAL